MAEPQLLEWMRAPPVLACSKISELSPAVPARQPVASLPRSWKRIWAFGAMPSRSAARNIGSVGVATLPRSPSTVPLVWVPWNEVPEVVQTWLSSYGEAPGITQ